MRPTAQAKCYIEEYTNERGQLSARLREKDSGRKVDLGLTADSRDEFLRFLGAARMNSDQLPGVFDKTSDESCVIVTGDLDFDAPDEIRFIYNESLSYLFA